MSGWREIKYSRESDSAFNPISFPESSFPLTSGQKTRALGATISGMRHGCRLRSETGWAESGYFLRYFKNVAPRALVFRPLVKGKEDSGNEIAFNRNYLVYYACATFDSVVSVTKKNLRIAGFFASLPFLIIPL